MEVVSNLWVQLFLASAGFGLGLAVLAVAFAFAERADWPYAVRNALAAQAIGHLTVLALRGAPPNTVADPLFPRLALILPALALLGFMWAGGKIPTGLLPFSGAPVRRLLVLIGIAILVVAGPIGLALRQEFQTGVLTGLTGGLAGIALLAYCLPLYLVISQGMPLRWRAGPTAWENAPAPR